MGVCLNKHNSFKFEAFGTIKPADEKVFKTRKLFIFLEILLVCLFPTIYAILGKKIFNVLKKGGEKGKQKNSPGKQTK